MRLLLVLPILLAAPAVGTFLQWSLCDDSRGSGIIPFGLNAQLVTAAAPDSENPAASRLKLNLARLQSGITCRDTPGASLLDESAWPEATVQLDWQGLRGRGRESFSARTRVRLDCEDFIGDNRPAWLPLNSSRVSMVLVDDEIGVLPALSSLRFRANIDAPVFSDAHFCIASLMTPAISPALSSGFRYGPLAVFVFIFFVSALRTMAAASAPPPQHQNEDDDSAGSAPAAAAAPPILLPSVSDCLHFLQFIFLTAGLSLSYPGFYPAAAGHLNWFALFADLALPIKSFVAAPTATTVRWASTYPGVSDGLYEVNGTYGGSLGLEVMTQMVGAPMTCDTWLLMVLFTAWIAVALGLFLWLLETLRPRNVLGSPMLGPGAGVGRRALVARVGNGVLRLVLSYITLPLIALSTYQLNFSGTLGAGHTALAVVVVLLIAAAFAWLAVQLPAASFGALVFSARHRYRRLERDEAAEGGDEEHLAGKRQARRDVGFVICLFLLNITRGLAVGALQKWGVVQLSVLMACEVVMLLAVQVFRPFPLLSGGFAATVLRLAVLACFVPFTFPPSKLFILKSIFAYVALSLYATGLIGVFFVPSCWHLYRLALRDASPSRDDRGDTPLVSLHHVQQRREAPEPRQTADVTSTARRPTLPVYGRLTSPRDHGFIGDKWDAARHHVSPLRRPARSQGSMTSLFYRQPRSPVPVTPGEASRFPNDHPLRSRVSTPSTLSAPPLTPSPAESPATSSPGSSEDSASTCSSSVADMQSSVAGRVRRGSSGSSPLGPRWDDYSFREADLFYAARPPLPPPASASLSGARRERPESGWGLLSWWNPGGRKPTPPREKGFSVVRPSRVPHRGPPLAPPSTSELPPCNEAVTYEGLEGG